MKISFILPGGGVSGGVRVTVAQANRLLRRGHEVRLLARRSPVNARGIYRYLVDTVIHSAHSWLKDFEGHLESFKRIDECHFDREEVIVGVGSYVLEEMVQLQSSLNRRVLYLHGTTPWDPERMKGVLDLQIPKIAVASYLVPLVEKAGDGEVIGIVPNGIDPTEYSPSVDESERNGVGTIYSSQIPKDPQTILASIQNICSLNAEIPVRVFGPEKRPKQLATHALYRQFPSVEQARELYSKSLVWIMASRWEGFSVPVLESMACGAVPVATDCGGPRDIIADGENGFLVKVGDVNQIVDRVMLLLSDPGLRDRMRSKAEATVDQFNWERSIDQLEDVLRKLA